MGIPTNGYYFPGTMRIRIDTDEPLKVLTTLDKDVQGAWHHEHHHYLQDVTTVSGAFTLAKLLDRFYKAVRFVQEEKGNVTIPLSGKVAAELREIVNFIEVRDGDIVPSAYPLDWGISPAKYEDLRIIKVVSANDPRTAAFIPADKGQRISILLEDTNKRKASYNFGAIAIREQMAHYMDRKFFRIPNQSKFPYRICEELAQLLCPGISGLPTLLFALCEVSLSYPLPGWAFYELLVAMNKDKIDFSKIKWDDIIAYGHRKFNEWQWDPRLQAEADVAEISQLSAQIFQGPSFEPTIKWLHKVFSEGLELRLKYPGLLTELFVESTAVRPNHALLFEILGAPIGMNRKLEMHMIVPRSLTHLTGSIFPQTLLIVQQMLEFFKSGKPPCSIPLYAGKLPNDCITISGNKNIGIACNGAPWKQIQAPICPFGSFWRLLKFDKVKFVRTNGSTL